MAKINFGVIVNDARGKVAGIVMSKNKSGAYSRTKVTPANPRTPAQQAVRSNFANMAQNWSGILSADARAAWIAFANTYPRRNIFGNSVTLNGLNMYVSLNLVLVQIGFSASNFPPPNNSVSPSTWANTFSALTAGTMTIDETAFGGLASGYNYVFATRPLPPGRAATPSDYRFVFSAVDPGVAGTFSIYTEYAAKYGNPTVGNAVYARIATVDSDSGLTSVSQPISGIVT